MMYLTLLSHVLTLFVASLIPDAGHKMAALTVMFLRGSVFLGVCTSSLEGSAGAGSQQQGLCVNKSGASSDFSACVKLKM